MPEIAEQKQFRFNSVEHVYTLNGSPLIGTTTALKVLAKELTWWASGMACKEFGWLNPKRDDKGIVIKDKALLAERLKQCLAAAGDRLKTIAGMTPQDYLKLLDTAYKAHNTRKEEAKDKGKDLHSSLEDFIKGEIMGCGVLFPDPRIKPFEDWAAKHVKRFLFSELCCYSEVLWCAGTADFGYEDMEGNYVLGDFKSAADVYFSYWAQVGGYDLQLSEQQGGFDLDGNKIFKLDKPFSYYAVFCERAGLDKPFFGHETARLRRAFSYIVNLYREKMFFEKDNEF